MIYDAKIKFLFLFQVVCIPFKSERVAKILREKNLFHKSPEKDDFDICCCMFIFPAGSALCISMGS